MTGHLPVRLRAASATPNFQFVSDGTPVGDSAVAAMRAVAEQDYETVRAIFGLGDVPGRPFTVTVDPRAGGAYHASCEDTGIHVAPDDAPSLLVAEHVECFQALGGKWGCGQTNGEALSRALAMTVRPFAVLEGLDGDVQGWWESGPQDFVNDNSADDQNEPANACGTLFLFWLHSRLGYAWPAIVAAGGETLGATYQALTGKDGAAGFAAFVADLVAFDQSGQLAIPDSGNPWVGATPVAPAPAPAAPAVPPIPAPPAPPQPTPEPCADDDTSWFEWVERRLFPHLDLHHPGWRKA